MSWDAGKFSLKNILFSNINHKLTFLFVIVGLVAPLLGISYLFFISNYVLQEAVIVDQSSLLKTTAAIIIALIAINAGVIGFFVSRSISKPIKELYNATREVEKGNFDVKTDIKTNDEIEKLGIAFNNTTTALGKLNTERNEIDNAKREFLSITSHELRSPMTPMKAQLQMLKNDYFGKLSKKQKESLEIVIRNADRLDKIILDFLEISRIEAAHLKFSFKKTNLADMIKETVDLMKGFASEKGITLKIKSDKLPEVEVDPDRLSQVLRNLINNAVKFSKKNGKIEIFAEAKSNHILFGVKDYGCGLTPENKIRVFEPFYQTEKASSRVHGGTGLGLAICRGIVEAQKGKIWVDTTIKKGSTFYFTVPLMPVYEIEPITVLFSPKIQIEQKLKEEFKTMLGPLGVGEFEELKSKNAILKKDLLEYVDLLAGQHIINEKRGELFKDKIGFIFGDGQGHINKNSDIPYNSEVD